MSAALSRQVEIGSVQLRLLPRPGFDLENVVIYDDPAFGAEPMLRASEVTAVLRVTSLFRGRIEIARLDLTEPSLNIVHADSGRWNLAALVERTSRTPLAPTAKAKLERRPGFPYIEASSARINFKSGREKKPFALTNADFSLWQDSENSWGVRLKAQPFRSDLNLSDLGVVRVNGTWQRAATLRETPIQFSFEWDRSQLGQLTKFFTGDDKGWRGAVQFEATASGTPLKLQVSSDASIRDFRRFDFASSEPLQFSAHCDGHYTSLDHLVHEIQCQAPLGGDVVTLQGDAGLPGSRVYALTLAADALPANTVAEIARRLKKTLPKDLMAVGTLRGSFSLRQDGAGSGAKFEGRGQFTGFRISSASNKAELSPGNVSFALVQSDTNRSAAHGTDTAVSNELTLAFDPFPMALGRGTPAMARVAISRSGYRIALTGDAEVLHALRAANLFGVPAINANAEGNVQLDLKIAGGWMEESARIAPETSAAQVTGTARLRNVHVEARGLNGPIEIATADLQLLPNAVHVSKLAATAAHATWTGSLDLPRGCGTPGACLVNFNLTANQAGLHALIQWASPAKQSQPWYRLLSSTTQNSPSFFATLHASGKIAVNQLLIRDLTATRATANVGLEKAKLTLSNLRGEWLGGQHQGDWQADFSVKPPAYSGHGTFSNLSLAQAAEAMKDDWITGTANGDYHVTAAGTGSDFWQSLEGTVQFDMSDGALPHISLANDAAALQVDHFQGHAKLHEGKIEVHDGELDSGEENFLVNGEASLKQELDFTLTRSDAERNTEEDTKGMSSRAYSITGTVSEPKVAAVTNGETQAQLKSQ